MKFENTLNIVKVVSRRIIVNILKLIDQGFLFNFFLMDARIKRVDIYMISALAQNLGLRIHATFCELDVPINQRANVSKSDMNIQQDLIPRSFLSCPVGSSIKDK
jgi:hypothetical protein